MPLSRMVAPYAAIGIITAGPKATRSSYRLPTRCSGSTVRSNAVPRWSACWLRRPSALQRSLRRPADRRLPARGQRRVVAPAPLPQLGTAHRTDFSGRRVAEPACSTRRAGASYTRSGLKDYTGGPSRAYILPVDVVNQTCGFIFRLLREPPRHKESPSSSAAPHFSKAGLNALEQIYVVHERMTTGIIKGLESRRNSGRES